MPALRGAILRVTTEYVPDRRTHPRPLVYGVRLGPLSLDELWRVQPALLDENTPSPSPAKGQEAIERPISLGQRTAAMRPE
jgi:hypothetical protein